MEVNDSTPLVFGNLGVGDTDLGRERLVGQPGLPGECAAQGDGEPAPQVGRVGVEQHCAGVVVALRAQRLTKPGVILGVLLAAGQAAAVWAGPVAPPWTAPQHSAILFAAGVDQADEGAVSVVNTHG